MLVLTRKIGETFVVGDDITVTVVDIIGGNKVRLGINAPSSVPVYREEIWLQIQEENRQAAAAGPDLLDQLEPSRQQPDRPRSRRRGRNCFRPQCSTPIRVAVSLSSDTHRASPEHLAISDDAAPALWRWRSAEVAPAVSAEGMPSCRCVSTPISRRSTPTDSSSARSSTSGSRSRSCRAACASTARPTTRPASRSREKLRGQIGGTAQASRNAQDGISLVQTAEGALNEVHAILQRVRELAVQYDNGTLSTRRPRRHHGRDRAARRPRSSRHRRRPTKFNSINLLGGSATITFQVGANAGETITRRRPPSSAAPARHGQPRDLPFARPDADITAIDLASVGGRRARRLRRDPEPPRAHGQQPRRSTRRTCRPPRAASATSTWRRR